MMKAKTERSEPRSEYLAAIELLPRCRLRIPIQNEWTVDRCALSKLLLLVQMVLFLFLDHASRTSANGIRSRSRLASEPR